MINRLKIECCNEEILENRLSDKEKIALIETHFKKILEALGLDTTDESLKNTPQRYAKMLVEELFCGLDEERFPKIAIQENTFNYKQPLIESHISIQSICEHHFLPILGYCHIAYIPKKKVIGLSKLHRIAQYFARRPQIQERWTVQISETIADALETPDVAVVIDALHLCVRMRGAQDQKALTRSFDLKGAFEKDPIRREFFDSIPKLGDFKL